MNDLWYLSAILGVFASLFLSLLSLSLSLVTLQVCTMGDGNVEEAFDISKFSLTNDEKKMLLMSNDEWPLHTWEELKSIISSNKLGELTRTPSQLRAYLTWTAETKKAYGDMTTFILKKRLLWNSLPASESPGGPAFAFENAIPFADRSDYRILLNDWPYGLAAGIVHVCVWLKVRLPIDDTRGDLTPEGRRIVEDFVGETFVKPLAVQGQDKVLWFKNWATLQSVRALEHFHVLIRDVSREKLDAILEWPSGRDLQKLNAAQ